MRIQILILGFTELSSLLIVKFKIHTLQMNIIANQNVLFFSLVECSILSNCTVKHTTNFDNGPFSSLSFRSNSQHCNQLIKPCRLLLNGLYFNSLGSSNLRLPQ